jgi:hypothetical protein
VEPVTHVVGLNCHPCSRLGPVLDPRFRGDGAAERFHMNEIRICWSNFVPLESDSLLFRELDFNIAQCCSGQRQNVPE